MKNIEIAQKLCGEPELEASLVRCEHFLNYLKGVHGVPTLGGSADQSKVLREAMEGDLKKRKFTFVNPEKAKVLDKMGHEWSFVLAHFPESKSDCEEAVYSYALERNDACIFHAMRVAERGLRILAKKFRVKLRKPIEYASWGDLLGAINTKYEVERKKKKTASQQRRLAFYARTAEKCERMNDLYRRDISHARTGTKHLERDALDALTTAREFMFILASKKRKGPQPGQTFVTSKTGVIS